MSLARPKVFTIPSDVPFLDALAEGLIARHFDPGDPASLARATVLLPTRRAARALGEHLVNQASAKGLATALLLPEIRTLGDVDEEAMLLAEDESAAPELPDALPPLRRRLLLMRLTQAWGDARAGAGRERLSTAQGFHLAAELERLIDRADTQGVALDRLGAIVPAELAAHWQEILGFLDIIARQWPAIEAGEDAIGPARRRAALMAQWRGQWEAHPPEGPVIAAGSTGTIPATAALLRVVAHLPEGAVILPGLDQALDEEAWRAVDASHPQGAMKALIETMGVARADVRPWPHGQSAAPVFRARLLNEALRPWPATDGWRAALENLSKEAVAPLGLHRIDAPHQGEEAKAIALILRQALETPDAIAALVTPDRRLARAVQAELKRWDIVLDDSAGVPLAQTPPGLFLRLLAHAAAERLAPVPLLALLKHPLMAPGSRAEIHRLDAEALRGLRPAPGLAGLIEAVTARAKHKDALLAFLERLGEAFGAFPALFERAGPVSFAALADAHLAAAEALAKTALWQGEAGEAVARLLQGLLAEAALLPHRPAADYPDFIDALLAAQVARPAYGRHPRLFIWGPLEARLQKADILVLGGLNEGSWPTEPAADPWMSRGMMAALGLPPPEQRLGLSAHDFVQGASGARTVYLTRAIKSDGAPTVASRWLVRLETLMGGLGLNQTQDPPAPWLSYARILDKPRETQRAIAPPRPTPPRETRPRELSVSAIERWIRDPYAIYARHILRLKPLDPLDAPPDAGLRGQVIHKIAELFARPDFDPADEAALARLLEHGHAIFDAHRIPADIAALWWPRFTASAAWLVETERKNRASGERMLGGEIEGRLTLSAAGGPFVLKARADRIDRGADGALIIADYKTGRPPTEKEMKAGLSPQLPLEAVIARRGGFAGIAAASVSRLRVLRLMGAEAGEEKEIMGVEALADMTEAELQALIARYDDPAHPYRSRPVPKFIRDEGPFDHLARVKEWSAGEAGEEDA